MTSCKPTWKKMISVLCECCLITLQCFVCSMYIALPGNIKTVNQFTILKQTSWFG